MNLKKEISLLKGALRTLSVRVNQLEVENAQLKQENHALRQENEELRRENEELRSRLTGNSKNSHRPPSSDGYSKKPALPRISSKPQGGQEGHTGKTLSHVSQPDTIIEQYATECDACHKLLQSDAALYVASKHQVFDLPSPQLTVSEYRLYVSQCSCGCRTKARLPVGLSAAPAQYGSSVKALSVLLNTEYKVPVKKIGRLFEDLFGYTFNESTALTANTSAFALLAEEEQYIKKQLLASATLHADETGIRVAGTLYWLHVASNDRYTHLFVHSKRGKEALESPDSILTQFKNRLMHDCWASYWHLSECSHVICNTHILRELQALHENGSRWATAMHAFLLNLYGVTKRIDSVLEEHRKKAIIEDFENICQNGLREEPPPVLTNRRGRVPKSKGRNLIERLQKYRDSVIEFAFHPNAPFTNNQAERDLRPVKTKQKVSACFRTLPGAKNYARIQGFISTLRKQGRNPFRQLINVFDLHFAWE